jgi:hypothetical protein
VAIACFAQKWQPRLIQAILPLSEHSLQSIKLHDTEWDQLYQSSLAFENELIEMGNI